MIEVIDFWAPWCGPCKVMGPIIDGLAAKYADNENILIRKVNADDTDSREELIESEIRSIPTLIFKKNGEPVNRIVGVKKSQELEAIIEELLVN